MTDNVTRWQLYTRFGPFEAERQDVIHFADGIPGFEGCRQFVLIASDQLAPLRCLQALEEPYPSFLVIDPALIDPGYDVALSARDESRLSRHGGEDAGADAADAPLLRLVMVTSTEQGATVNLRAPIVISTRQMIGCQVIPEESAYSVSHPLALG
jgi:flagellar assembly factor FliW